MANNKEVWLQKAHKTIDELHKLQPKLNAVVSFVDVEKQVDEAMDKTGPLAGMPVILKDNVLYKGVRATASSYMLDNYVATYDATVVSKFKEAGAIIVAKSSLDELGMGGSNITSFTGPVHNPYDLSRIAGGSSGGSAALVASGAVDLAIGTDTGDSIRKPAAFCGIVGFKPTYGRISRYGVIPYASSLDHVGYFTREVKLAAEALMLLSGRDDKDMTSISTPLENVVEVLDESLANKRIGIFKNVLDAIDDEDTRALFFDLMDKAKEQGATLVDISMNSNLIKTVLPTYYIIANCEATANHSNLDGVRFGTHEDGDTLEEIMTNTRTKGFGPLIRKRFVIGSYGLMDENQELLLKKAQRVRRKLVEATEKMFESVDVIVAPASSHVAPKLNDPSIDQLSDKYLVAENYMVLGNFTGYPSITIPMGMKNHLPLGINLLSKAYDEKTLLQIAFQLEKLTGLKGLKAKVEL